MPKPAAPAQRTTFFGDLWKPLPKQKDFLEVADQKRYVLYGGSRGSGKSQLLRWASLFRLLRWAQQGLQGVRVIIYSEDYPTLEDRQISKIAREFPAWLGEIKRTQIDGLGFYVAPEYGGGVILLRSLDNPGKQIGGEAAGIAVEELTRIDKSTFDAIRGSVRWPGITDTYVWGATNPLGVGLQWVRQLWIERDFPPEYQGLAEQFAFVKALPTDNPYLTPDYWADLRSQPPHIQRAWIEGDWYVPVGVMFEELAPEHHQVPDSPIVEGAECFISIDWGYEHEAVAGWYEVTGNHQAPRIRMYREYVKTRMTPADFAQQVVSQTCTPNEHVRKVVLDSAAWATPQDGGPSPAEQMQATFQQAKMVLEPTPKGAGSRVRGWQLLHTWLQHRPGGPLLTFTTACKLTWAQLTTVVRGEPPQDIEDLKPGQADDRADQLRYALASRPEPPRVTAQSLRDQMLAERMRVDPRASDLAKAQAERIRKLPAIPVVVRKLKQPRTPWAR
jgi:phage terminase large subunit